jgi:hypothetical protein
MPSLNARRDSPFIGKTIKNTFHCFIKLALKQLNTQGRLYYFTGITLNEWKR